MPKAGKTILLFVLFLSCKCFSQETDTLGVNFDTAMATMLVSDTTITMHSTFWMYGYVVKVPPQTIAMGWQKLHEPAFLNTNKRPLNKKYIVWYAIEIKTWKQE